MKIFTRIFKNQDFNDSSSPSFPDRVTIENTSRCNLACCICLRRAQPPEPRDMELWLFNKIIEEISMFKPVIGLSVTGEPLASGFIDRQLELIGKFDLKLDFYTNGTLIKRQGIVNQLIPLLQCIRISVHGVTPRTYASLRGHHDFDLLKDNIIFLTKKRDELEKNCGNNSSRSFSVVLVTVLMKSTIMQLEELIRLAACLNVDSIECSGLVIHESSLIEESLHDKKEIVSECLERAEALAFKLGIPFYHPESTFSQTKTRGEKAQHMLLCTYPWKQAWIGIEGDVHPCCHAQSPGSMGNLREKTFGEIWTGEAYGLLRKSLLTGDRLSVSCMRCYLVDKPEPSNFDQSARGAVLTCNV